MEPLTITILIFFVGLLASFIGTISSGAGLVSLPLLLLFGMPPQVAVATNKFGFFGFDLGPLKTYHKHRQIIWKWVLPFTIITTLGSIIGALILLSIESSILTKFVGASLLFIALFLILKPAIGTKSGEVGAGKKFAGYLLKGLVSIFGGILGAGSGFFSALVHYVFFGLTVIQSKATGKIPSIISSIASLLIFAYAGIIDYTNGVSLLAGMFIGGYMGGHMIIKKGNEWARNLILIVIVISSIKLLFFS